MITADLLTRISFALLPEGERASIAARLTRRRAGRDRGGVPLSVLAAMGGVWLTEGDNNIFTQVGLVVLAALACKNAILIVEFARELELQGRSIRGAALEACRLRLRPILMTSLAFIMGVVPLVMSTGAGAEIRRALGVAVFSGMLGVTVFGL
jgi:multidrug efflux pump